MVRFYLDNIEVDAPDNWEDFVLKLSRSKDIDALLLTTETTLKWIESGYVYLMNKINTDGVCSYADLTITDDEPTLDTQVYNGRIFLSSCEIDEGECSIRSKVEDRSFFAMINNNKAIKAELTAELSKGVQAIDPAESYVVDMLDTTQALVRSSHTVRVFEAFRYLVDFMTDGQVQFSSTLFDIAGSWEGLCVTTGQKLRGATGFGSETPPLTMFSFKELYEEVKKKIPICIYITESIGVYTLNIESIEAINQSTGSFRFEDIDTIKTKFNEDKLYSSVKVGSETIDPSQSFPETQAVVGFKEEQFFNNIVCNVDSELDLVSEWIISSNVIEDCIVNGAVQYDDDLFLIDTVLTSSSVGTISSDDVFNGGVYFYNKRLRNEEVLLRYGSGIPESAIQYFNGTPSDFYAFRTADESSNRVTTITNSGVSTGSVTGTITGIFDEDTIAPGVDAYSVYDSSLFLPPVVPNVFTAPADAFYNFSAFIGVTLLGKISGNFSINSLAESADINAGGVSVRLEYDIYAPGPVSVVSNVPLGTVASGQYRKVYRSTNNFHNPYTYNYVSGFFDFGIYLRTGDMLSLTPIFQYNAYNMVKVGTATGTLTIDETIEFDQSSFFSCVGNSTENPFIQAGDINQYLCYEHEFRCDLTASEFMYLRDNSRDKVEFSMNGRPKRYGWINDLKYNWITGEATVKLESNAINNATTST